MGGSSIGYLLREGARNIYANKQMSVAAIGVLVACMLLIGASIVFSFNANSFVGYVEAQNEVVVFLKDNLSDDRISEVEQQLKIPRMYRQSGSSARKRVWTAGYSP